MVVSPPHVTMTVYEPGSTLNVQMAVTVPEVVVGAVLLRTVAASIGITCTVALSGL
jgi:hypothetical protein